MSHANRTSLAQRQLRLGKRVEQWDQVDMTGFIPEYPGVSYHTENTVTTCNMKHLNYTDKVERDRAKAGEMNEQLAEKYKDLTDTVSIQQCKRASSKSMPISAYMRCTPYNRNVQFAAILFFVTIQLGIAKIIHPFKKLLPKISGTLLTFRTGSAVCVGCKSELEALLITHAFRKLAMAACPGRIRLTKFKTRNRVVVGNSGHNVCVDRAKLHAHNPMIVSYKPGHFPGAIIKVNGAKATIALFESGKFIITGIRSNDEAIETVLKKVGPLVTKVTYIGGKKMVKQEVF